MIRKPARVLLFASVLLASGCVVAPGPAYVAGPAYYARPVPGPVYAWGGPGFRGGYGYRRF